MLPLPRVRMSACLKTRTSQYPVGMLPARYPAKIRIVSVSALASSNRDAVGGDPAVHNGPVQVVEERVDVAGAVGLEVEEVGVLVHVERDERGGVPDWVAVLGVANVVGEAPLVPVVGGPGPAAAAHAGRLEVGAPGLDGTEVALDQVADRAVRVAAVAAQVLEVDLVVLDPADREGQVDLQRAHLGVDLVRGSEVDLGQLCEDLVALVYIPLIELVVGLDGLAGDPVELEQAGLQLFRGDLLAVV